jgi:hypothetical protein
MCGVKRAAAVMICTRPIFAAMMLLAQRYHAHVRSRIWQVMHFNWPRSANQARQLSDTRHVRFAFRAIR